MATSFQQASANIIGGFEGFIAKATWDENAYRLGFGSDTITLNDGTYRKVQQGDVTNLENAKKDLARRIPEFEGYIRGVVGSEAYNKLPQNTKSALISIAYNSGAGSLGKNINNALYNAIQTGDPNKIGDTIVSSTINLNTGKSWYPYFKLRRATEGRIAKVKDGLVSDIKRVGNTFNLTTEKGGQRISKNPSKGNVAPVIIGTLGLIAIITLTYYLINKKYKK